METSPKINPPGACRYYFLVGGLIWNIYECFDNSFPFIDGFRAQRLNIACRMCEEELWCYFYSRLIVCLKELKKIECPWLIIPKYDDSVAVCPEFIWSVKQYLKKRNRDEFITDKVFDYSNKGHFINIDDTIQDLNTLPNPDSWTPLATRQKDDCYAIFWTSYQLANYKRMGSSLVNCQMQEKKKLLFFVYFLLNKNMLYYQQFLSLLGKNVYEMGNILLFKTIEWWNN